MEKSCDLGKEVRDSDQSAYPITRNKGKEPVILDDVDTPVDDELSSGSSPSLSLSPTKNARESAKAKSRKRPSQSNGQAKASNKTILIALKKRLHSAKGKWVDDPPGVLRPIEQLAGR